ncbi:hypothetical protein U1Q18_046815, partial [Sarracenia purpurea var. burkii]
SRQGTIPKQNFSIIQPDDDESSSSDEEGPAATQNGINTGTAQDNVVVDATWGFIWAELAIVPNVAQNATEVIRNASSIVIVPEGTVLILEWFLLLFLLLLLSMV